MILEGDQSLAGSPGQVWQLLLDPAVLAKVMPGTRELERITPDRYRGRMAVSVGPITAAEFALEISLSDVEPPRRYLMNVKADGKFGFTRGQARVELEPQPEGGTRMVYHADLHIGGKIASVGQRLLDMVSRTMLRTGLQALGRELEQRLEQQGQGGGGQGSA